MKQNIGLDNIMKWLQQKKWKQMKKSDWLIVALAGVLLLVIAMPTGQKQNTENTSIVSDNDAETQSEDKITEDAYAASLERRLKDVLEEMDGVGKVEVMITLSDSGENIVQKDVTQSSNATTETDSGGGSRTVTESESEETTVYVESGEEKYPYIKKEELPTVEGVVVVAEGAKNTTVISDISEAVQSLFSVQPHKVKVVKMRMQEESN